MPAATTRPASTIATRSHTSSTSDRRCELRKTVVPRSRAARMIRRTSARPTGSSADVGSSSRTSSGSAEQGDAEAEALLHALRERPDQVVGPVGQPDGVERRVDLGRARPDDGRSGQRAVEREHLAGAQPRLVAEQLGQVADAPARLPVAERCAEHGAAVAGGRPGETEQQLDRGGLARAVRPEEAEHLAALDAHRQPGQGRRPPVALDQVDRLDRRLHRRHRARDGWAAGA